MRSREELERLALAGQNPLVAILHALLDIRDLLQNANGGHGQETRTAAAVPAKVEDIIPPKKDELFDDAVAVVRAASRVNTDLLRVKFGISYGRASSLIEDLEAADVITAPDKNGRRKVV